jgi:hypothetical protein
MSETKESGKPKGWLPDFNQLIVVVLAGTVLVSQNPFHHSRPNKAETAGAKIRLVDARPWQDPFESVEKHINKHGAEASSLANLQQEIGAKTTSGITKKLSVVAVMLPDGSYFEDSETRRKLRYAVLSGFSAALRYMPEDANHIHYFQTSEAKNPVHKAAYEWMVYKPFERNQEPASKDARKYDRPPVLVLWLASSEFTGTPHKKMGSLRKR